MVPSGWRRSLSAADDEVRIDEGGAASDFARGWTPAGAAGDSACAAPEQLSGRAVDQRADLYSLGAAFYELLTLRRPGTSPDPPSSINRTVPKGFDALLLRLLAAAPEDRYASAEEVLADLAALRRSPQLDGRAGAGGRGGPGNPAGRRSPRGHDRRRRGPRRDRRRDCGLAPEFVSTGYDRRRRRRRRSGRSFR